MITVIADDLSGAQEAFAAMTGLGERSEGPGLLVLDVRAVPAAFTGPLAVDIDARGVGAAAAGMRLRRSLKELAAQGRLGDQLMLKLDSLVRGPVAGLVGAFAELAPVVLCPAVPALGRTVVDGVIHVGGVPLDTTELWAVESHGAPHRVADLFGEAATTGLTLGTVRSEDLSDRLDAAMSDARIVIADAETENDCEAIARAALDAGAVIAGAAGVLGAAGRLHIDDVPVESGLMPEVSLPGSAPVSVVVGSAAPSARAQVEVLATAGVEVISWEPGRDLSAAAAEDRVFLLDVPFDAGRAVALNEQFAAAVAAAVGDSHLVLTGGQTARAVLDLLGIERLRPLAEPHHGAVTAITTGGRLVTTRPGSFGDRDSLRTILDFLNSGRLTSTEGSPA